jgi:hypothetical protein
MDYFSGASVKLGLIESPTTTEIMLAFQAIINIEPAPKSRENKTINKKTTILLIKIDPKLPSG